MENTGEILPLKLLYCQQTFLIARREDIFAAILSLALSYIALIGCVFIDPIVLLLKAYVHDGLKVTNKIIKIHFR